MIFRLIIALILLALIYGLFRYLMALDNAQRKRFVWKSAAVLLVGVTLIAVLAGKMHWIGAVLAALIGFAKVGIGTLSRLLPFIGLLHRNQVFGQPRFRTPHLEMVLDTNTNRLSGTVKKGPYSGEQIETLEDAKLVELEAFYKERDKRSYYLIRVIRQQQGYAHNHNQNRSRPAQENLDISEAKQILGLSDTPTKKDVIQAHRKLMQKLHPDRGGNDYLASRVNLAKEVLIKNLSQ